MPNDLNVRKLNKVLDGAGQMCFLSCVAGNSACKATFKLMKLETALPIKNWLLRNLSMCVLNVDDSQYITDKANDILRSQGKVADLTEPQVFHAMALLTYEELNTPITERNHGIMEGDSIEVQQLINMGR